MRHTTAPHPRRQVGGAPSGPRRKTLRLLLSPTPGTAKRTACSAPFDHTPRGWSRPRTASTGSWAGSRPRRCPASPMACTRFPLRPRIGSWARSTTRTRSARRPTFRRSWTSARGRTSIPSSPRGTPRSGILSKNKSRFTARGITVPVPEWPVLRQAMDKHALAELAEKIGCPVPSNVPTAHPRGGRGHGRAGRVPAAAEAPLLVGLPGRAARAAPRAAGGDHPGVSGLRDAHHSGVDSGAAGPARQRERHHGPSGPAHHRGRSPQRPDGLPLVRLRDHDAGLDRGRPSSSSRSPTCSRAWGTRGMPAPSSRWTRETASPSCSSSTAGRGIASGAASRRARTSRGSASRSSAASASRRCRPPPGCRCS